MKTLYKNIRNGAQARAKQIELEKTTGLKLTCYHTGDGWNFRPYLHDGIESSTDTEKILRVNDVLPISSTGYSFTLISAKTGLSIQDTLKACKALIEKRFAAGDVSRNGKVVGVHRLYVHGN